VLPNFTKGEPLVKKIISLMLIVVLSFIAICLAPPAGSAAELKPVVTVSFAGYSELMADVDLIGKLGGKPDMSKAMEGMIAMMTQGKGLGGLDQNQPIGMVMLTDGNGAFITYGFLPVSNLDQLMELMKNPLTGEAPKAENGVYQLHLGPTGSVSVAQRGNWAYVAWKKETLDNVDPNPAAFLRDLPQKYLLAVRASVNNVSAVDRQNFLLFLPAAMQMQMQRAPNESDAEYAVRTAMLKQNIDQIKMLAEELDEVLLGLNIDRQSNKAYLDLELTAKAGTKLANQLAASKPGKSDFAWLKSPEAAITYNATNTFTDADVARAKNSLNSILVAARQELQQQDLDKEQLDLATELLNDLFAVVIKTIELKRTDMGMALVLEPTAVTVAGGSLLADGMKLDGAVKKLLAEVQKEQMLKISEENYQAFELHNLSVDTPDQKLAPMFGDTIDVTLAISDNKVFVAAGRDALKTVKQAIDKSLSESAREIPAVQLVVTTSKIAKFVAAVAEEDKVKDAANKISVLLEQAKGKDHITLNSQPIANGARIRLEVEEGILKVIGSAEQFIPMGPGM
jgi:hypothetical protein